MKTSKPNLFYFLMVFLCLFSKPVLASDPPYCSVTKEGDVCEEWRLRYVFERILNDNGAGGCNIQVETSEGNLADNDVAQNLVWFYTPEFCSTCTDQVRYFKIDFDRDADGSPDPLIINPFQTVMVGNYSRTALDEGADLGVYEQTYDSDLQEDRYNRGYYPNDASYEADKIQDGGFVILDLTAFDEHETETGITCGKEANTTYLRNFGVASGKFDSWEDFLKAHPCLADAGGNEFCSGKVLNKSGQEADPERDGPNDFNDIHNTVLGGEWCKPSCSRESKIYPDLDGDSFGDADATGEKICVDEGIPTGKVDNNDDCKDTDSEIHPGQTETCDFIDRDCDGNRFNDATDTKTLYRDSDGDDFGDEGKMIETCQPIFGYIKVGGDCDDTNSAVNPGATDICNDAGIDYDCDGTVIPGSSWYVDADGDTYGDPLSVPTTACVQPVGYSADITDCLDTDLAVYPSASEVCNDGIDQNCDGADDLSCVGGGSVEICTDGIDNDGVNGTDCDDPACSNDSACTVSAEICDDGLDNDFNNFTDCADAACASSSHCNAKEPELICDDGQDNDIDLAFDCDDADCAFTDVCVLDKIETSCQDGLDDEPDTLTDCFDPDCADAIIFEGTDANGNPVSLTCLDMLDVNSTCKTYSTTDGDGDGLPDCVDVDIIPPPPVSSGGCSGNCDLNAKNQMTETQLMMSLGLLLSMILIVTLLRQRIENREKARGL